MSKFETIGVQNLEDCVTKQELRKAHQRSCRCCCKRGMKLDCEHCAIDCVYHQIMAIMDDQAKLKNHSTETSIGAQEEVSVHNGE
ncbi:MAG: hypothetical protein NC131_12625 [Roseburia sp.]|nr:hypothetical protein [Roseburia sp.]